jgi:hypothetical protein
MPSRRPRRVLSTSLRTSPDFYKVLQESSTCPWGLMVVCLVDSVMPLFGAVLRRYVSLGSNFFSSSFHTLVLLAELA